MFILRYLITRYPRKSQRILETLPGITSWMLILFPFWGSIVVPMAVAYYIIAFDVYWLYRSVSMAGMAIMAHFRIQAGERYDWMGDVKDFKDWEKVRHVVVIPNYKEPGHTLERTLNSLLNQTFPAKQLIPIVAFEDRAGDEINNPREELLRKKFDGKFAELIFTRHPAGIVGEVVGKSANSAWAAKQFREELKKHTEWEREYITISSMDADVVFDINYFAAVAFKFLDNPDRYSRIWQGAIMFYNNLEQIPFLMRVFNRIASVVQIASLVRQDRLVNFSTYTLSWNLMDEIGLWDADVIPEDYRLFFKAYFETGGRVEVEPVFLPVYADAAESIGFWKTFVNTYEQVKRWSWGASDDPYIIKRYIMDKKAPFWDKTIRVLKVLEDHFLWPVNWFVLTLGATLPPLLNEQFSRTVIGKTLPQVSSTILTLSMVSLLAVFIVELQHRPGMKAKPWYMKILSLLELVVLPVVGLVFSALPGLDAHTRLMMGRYIEYRVTEKV